VAGLDVRKVMDQTEEHKRRAFEERFGEALRSGDPKLVHAILDSRTAEDLGPKGYILNPFIDLLQRKAYDFEYLPPVDYDDFPARCLYVLKVTVRRGQKWGGYCVGDVGVERKVMFRPH